MANHPNRNAANISKLQSHWISCSSNFKPGVLYDVDSSDGRLLFIADWESRKIFLTVKQGRGAYWPPVMQQGLAEEFSVDHIAPPGYDVKDFVCDTDYLGRDSNGEMMPRSVRRMKYHDYILERARAAQKIIDDANYDEGDEVDEAVKAKVRVMLQPFTEERMRAMENQYYR